MRHFPAQLGRPLDAVGLGAARLVVVGAPVPLLAVGAAVEDREAARAPRRRLGAADRTLARQGHQILVHCFQLSLLLVVHPIESPSKLWEHILQCQHEVDAGVDASKAEESLRRLNSPKFCFPPNLPHEVEVFGTQFEGYDYLVRRIVI